MSRWYNALVNDETRATSTKKSVRTPPAPTDKTDKTPSHSSFVGFVGTGSAQIHEIFGGPIDDKFVEFEERAAILEYDAGYCREDAERIARREVYGGEAQ